MPSAAHELPLDLIRNDPKFAVELFREVSGMPLPTFTSVRDGAAEATHTAPPELVSDSVVVCERDPHEHEGGGRVKVMAVDTFERVTNVEFEDFRRKPFGGVHADR